MKKGIGTIIISSDIIIAYVKVILDIIEKGGVTFNDTKNIYETLVYLMDNYNGIKAVQSLLSKAAGYVYKHIQDETTVDLDDDNTVFTLYDILGLLSDDEIMFSRQEIKETILEVLKELVNEVAPESDDTVSKKLGKFGWIEIDVQNQVGVPVDTDEFGQDVYGNVLTAHLSIGNKDDFDPEVDEEYECDDIIASDATVYNRSDIDEECSVQTLVEGDAVNLEEIAANFAKEVEYYLPQYQGTYRDNNSKTRQR